MRSGIRRPNQGSSTARATSRRRAAAVLGTWVVVAGALAPHAFADETAPNQWYLTAMQAAEMWKVSTGKGIKVAVVDTGVNPDTHALKGQVLAQDVPKNASYGATQDYDGHGTTMAELIAGTGEGAASKGWPRMPRLFHCAFHLSP